MKEVQYAWIVGMRALSGASEVPQIDCTSAVCVTPRPFAALLVESTSQLFCSQYKREGEAKGTHW
jgi:hypothetical protein